MSIKCRMYWSPAVTVTEQQSWKQNSNIKSSLEYKHINVNMKQPPTQVSICLCGFTAHPQSIGHTAIHLRYYLELEWNPLVWTWTFVMNVNGWSLFVAFYDIQMASLPRCHRRRVTNGDCSWRILILGNTSKNPVKRKNMTCIKLMKPRWKYVTSTMKSKPR